MPTRVRSIGAAVATLLAVGLFGCSDPAATATTSPADTSPDAPLRDAEGDSPAPDDADAQTADASDGDEDPVDTDDALPDTPEDVGDVEPLVPPLPGPIALAVHDATLLADSDAEVLMDRFGDVALYLGPGARATWTVTVEGDGLAQVALDAAVWRHEGARVRVTVDGEAASGEAWSLYGARTTATVVAPRSDEADDFGADYRPPPMTATLGAGEHTVSLEVADTGGLYLYEAWLLPANGEVADTLPTRPRHPTADGLPIVDLAPCAAADCDDGAAINAAIAEVEGPVHVRLAEGDYTLHSSIQLRRDGVWVTGAGLDATRLLWSPVNVEPGWRGAVEVVGAGPRSVVAVLEPTVAHARTLTVAPELAVAVGDAVQLTADDFGDVPALCLNGRDVERLQRHITWIGRVVAVEPVAEGQRLRFDRQLDHAIPLEANPRAGVAYPVHNVGIAALTLTGDCPEADEIPPYTQRAAVCTNQAILEHSAISLLNASNTTVADVMTRHFGRFGVYVTSSFETTVLGGGVERPADYGGGGAGYGVHAIRSGRTLVWGYATDQARHGVVTDFGSTETQVVASRFARCSLAALDIHGEASLDTLLLGNELADNAQGIIVGGGGRAVHCNDGPRHHLVGNQLDRCTATGIVVTDYSSDVHVEHNSVNGSLLPVLVDSGSQHVRLWRNRIGAQGGVGVSVTGHRDGTDDVTLQDNRFVGPPPGYSIEEGITHRVEGSSQEP